MDDSAASLRARALTRVGGMLKQRWRLDALIGVGGMAAVYAATHRNGSRVAIKILYPEFALLADISERFLREGYVANKVNHPGTVRVLDDDKTDEGEPFLVMDLLEGQSLEELRRARGGTIPLSETLAIADSLLDVLAAAHDAGIVHRDIKPQNIFMTATESGGMRARLLDFGVARLAEASRSATLSGGVFGTPAFMAPEQASGRSSQIDARSDLWAVGATIFYLLAGRYVHEAENVQAQLVSAAVSPAPGLASVVNGVPPDVAAVVDRALSFAKAGRYPDARTMRNALRALSSNALPADRPSASMSAGAAPVQRAPSVPVIAAEDTSEAEAASLSNEPTVRDDPRSVLDTVSALPSASSTAGHSLGAITAPAGRARRAMAAGIATAVTFLGIAIWAVYHFGASGTAETPVSNATSPSSIEVSAPPVSAADPSPPASHESPPAVSVSAVAPAASPVKPPPRRAAQQSPSEPAPAATKTDTMDKRKF